jgi:hypothetical protein
MVLVPGCRITCSVIAVCLSGGAVGPPGLVKNQEPFITFSMLSMTLATCSSRTGAPRR